MGIKLKVRDELEDTDRLRCKDGLGPGMDPLQGQTGARDGPTASKEKYNDISFFLPERSESA